jgi:hypothetical protein
MVKCSHKTYATNLSARQAARDMGLVPRKAVHRCQDCGKWKVAP